MRSCLQKLDTGFCYYGFVSLLAEKSITIFYFFLSEIIFHEKMVSLSNNDRFDNDKIFLCNIWHFSIINLDLEKLGP